MGAMTLPLTRIQYISDDTGALTGVIVPIELWREIASAAETAYLLGSEAMRRRLLEARQRHEGIPFEEARGEIGI